MMPVKHAIKRLGRIGLHQLGGLNSILWSSRTSFRILYYHRFSPSHFPNSQAILSQQCEFLTRNFRVTPLSEIARALNAGAPVPPKTLAVTIDDGYRDILTDAFPVFDKWKIPVTAYLISDFLDGKLWPWWDQVSYAVKRTRRQSASIEILGQVSELSLKTNAEKEAAIEQLTERMKRVPNRSRLKALADLPHTLDVEIPKDAPGDDKALTWKEVRTLAESGMEFGAHTKTHPILPNVEDAAELQEEIGGSKARIEQELGRPVIHFSYPNGDWNDACDAVVQSCGFATAVTAEPGLNRPNPNRYQLKRLCLDLSLSSDYFREQTAGMHLGQQRPS
ncbi:MAG TPA: polysaccharide deacetylase family protein [Bryobacteraceae bacterium]|jgi:peptidoglycan/xylan/chitin deacetylase (PgdA/CDA1 family)